MEDNYTLAKWLAGELSEAELQAFERTSEFPIYQKIANYSSQLEAPAFDESKLYDKIVSTKKESVKVIAFHQTMWFKIAAIFVLFAGLSVFYKSSIAISEYAENGEQTNFLLPDNSQVVLNAGSEIDYNKWNWNKNRHLELAGEAYFRVAKGKKFEVQTDLGTVTVLGTQFNVKARGNRFDVTCYEGRVKVNYQQQQVIITRGNRVSFENGVLLKIPNTNATKPEWTAGELTFVDANLASILDEMQRQYDCTIQHQNIVSTQLFTGTLPADDLEKGLQILSSMYHVKYTRSSNNEITLELLNVEE
ncbi:MAG: FecR domain-containing protein [Flavobacterium sp.]|nr:FecR domain-containing protein [Flavobacterium sp.]